MGFSAPRRSKIVLAAMGVVASTGSAYVGAKSLLSGQADQVREVIPKSRDAPPRADGVYVAGGDPVQRWTRGMPVDIHLMIFGDSTATGFGCRTADEVPGVLLARGLADAAGKRVRLSTKAIVGATSKGLSGQVDAMFVAGPPPDAAVIMVGANDITLLNGIGPSARRLGAAVRRLRASGAVVVVGTCPDFGVITAIPQPLRWVARNRGLRLARAQAVAVRSVGGTPVPLADIVRPEFLQTPDLLFSDDQYHPSAAGYELAARQLFPALCEALSNRTNQSVVELPGVWSNVAIAPQKPRSRVFPRLWRRSTGVPAPIVVPTG